MHIVLTEDGRVYSGIPAEENERQWKLRVANREAAVTIAKSQTMQTAALCRAEALFQRDKPGVSKIWP